MNVLEGWGDGREKGRGRGNKGMRVFEGGDGRVFEERSGGRYSERYVRR